MDYFVASINTNNNNDEHNKTYLDKLKEIITIEYNIIKQTLSDPNNVKVITWIFILLLVILIIKILAIESNNSTTILSGGSDIPMEEPNDMKGDDKKARKKAAKRERKEKIKQARQERKMKLYQKTGPDGQPIGEMMRTGGKLQMYAKKSLYVILTFFTIIFIILSPIILYAVLLYSVLRKMYLTFKTSI